MKIDHRGIAVRWAEIIARGYSHMHEAGLRADLENWLAKQLADTIESAVILAIPFADWPVDIVNPSLQIWEAMARQGAGPRLVRLDIRNETVEFERPVARSDEPQNQGAMARSSLREYGRRMPA